MVGIFDITCTETGNLCFPLIIAFVVISMISMCISLLQVASLEHSFSSSSQFVASLDECVQNTLYCLLHTVSPQSVNHIHRRLFLTSLLLELLVEEKPTITLNVN